MGFLTFAKTALGQLVSPPVTVDYPAQPAPMVPELRGHVRCDIDTCILCGMCARRCPALALKVDRKGGTWAIDPYACVACGECVESCPKGCLSMDPHRSPVAAARAEHVERKPV